MKPRLPPPLALTDDQLSTIMTAAGPLHPAIRGLYLERVAEQLRDHRVIGDGLIGRITKQVQRQFLRPPQVELGPEGEQS
jgi:hypothetical protein